MNLIGISNQIFLALVIVVTAENKNVSKTELQSSDQNISLTQRPNNDKNISQIHSHSNQISPNCSIIENIKEMIPKFVNFLHAFSQKFHIGYLGLCFHNPRLENGKLILTKRIALVFMFSVNMLKVSGLEICSQ